MTFSARILLLKHQTPFVVSVFESSLTEVAFTRFRLIPFYRFLKFFNYLFLRKKSTPNCGIPPTPADHDLIKPESTLPEDDLYLFIPM